jgi:hypothetical protein
MKYFLFALLLFACSSLVAQFHVKVTCNPDHEGIVNPAWRNNYIVEWTSDNWVHSFIIQDQLTWQGYRDDGSDYYSSTY